MGEKRRRLQAVLNAKDFPGEILTGVPVLEVHGDTEAIVCGHRGVLAYDPSQIRVATANGPVTLDGENLEIFRMNRERIVVHGKILALRLKGEEPC